MKMCPRCNSSNSDENVVCSTCGSLFEQPKSKYSFYNKPIIRNNKGEKEEPEKPEETTKSVQDVVEKFKGYGRKVLDKIENIQKKTDGDSEFVYDENEAKKVEMESQNKKSSFVFDEKAEKKAARLEKKSMKSTPRFIYDDKPNQKEEKVEEPIQNQEKSKPKFFYQEELENDDIEND